MGEPIAQSMILPWLALWSTTAAHSELAAQARRPASRESKVAIVWLASHNMSHS